MDCAAVRKHHRFGELALCRQVAGNALVVSRMIHEVGRPVDARIKDKHVFFQFKSNYVDRGDVVGVSAHEDKCVGFVPERVRQQRRRKIDVGAFFGTTANCRKPRSGDLGFLQS